MDWPKAKAYLVGIFLAVDLLLAYDVTVGQRAALRPAAALPAGRLLAREGIVLLGDLPTSYPRRLAGLRVRAASPDPEETARRVLGTGAAGRGGGREGTVFEKGRERLIFLPDGGVLYENRSLGEASVGPPLDGGAARRVAAAFLTARGWRPAEAADDLTLPLAGGIGYQVTLVRRHGDLAVFPSYLSLLVTTSGVQAAEQDWLVPVGSAGESLPVLPPAEALRRVRARVRAGGDGMRLLVERVDLGFAGERPPGAESWVLRPVWRVLTRGGTAFYVYNPDGGVEAAP